MTLKKKMEKFLNKTWTIILMTLLTISALFGDDIRVLVVDKDGDAYFWEFSCICIVMFLVEMLLGCYAKPDYFNSFFFGLI